MTTLVFFVEEPSMKAFLDAFLPRILPDGYLHTVIKHNGKTELEGSLERKLKAWNTPNCQFFVLRDQDAADCRKVKAGLVDIVARTGKPATVRVVCRELECWFLGDLAAVEHAFERPGLAARQNEARFRSPDSIANAPELLSELIEESAKVERARRMGVAASFDSNASTSFSVFMRSIRRAIGGDNP